MRSAARTPPFLKPGDRVRVVAPSGAFDREKFSAGLAGVIAQGLRAEYDDGLFARERYLAGPDARRLAELQSAIDDPEVRAIWCARGGYGATRLLPRLDLRALERAPKWLIGFSDATALHALWQGAGCVSLHGANVTTLDGWSPAAREALWGWLCRGEAEALRGTTERGRGVVEGSLVGGNLTVLAALAGTTALPDFEGRIVLLEDVGERPYRLDRCLTTLAQAGALARARAVVVGQLSGCDEPNTAPPLTGLSVVLEVLREIGDFPILSGLAIGHDPTSFPVPLGAPARLDLDRGELHVSRLAAAST